MFMFKFRIVLGVPLTEVIEYVENYSKFIINKSFKKKWYN